MNKLLTLLILWFGTGTITAQQKKTISDSGVTAKFGALAIDKSNGFYYGFSYDYSSLSQAEQKATEECIKKGGNCSVVLSFSGNGCLAYRTMAGDTGNAYGWGVANTKEEADAVAKNEFLKRVCKLPIFSTLQK